MKRFKMYYGLHLATVGIAMTALGVALFVKGKREERNCGCH